MGRPQGLPKTGGRQKGTPNKKTQVLGDKLEALGLDVPSRLVELLPGLSPEIQAKILLDLLSYIHPKRKAVDQTAVGHEIELEEMRERFERPVIQIVVQSRDGKTLEEMRQKWCDQEQAYLAETKQVRQEPVPESQPVDPGLDDLVD